MKRFFFYFFLLLTTCGILGAGTLFGVYIWASQNLPSITKVQDYQLPQVSTVYGRDGTIIGYFSKEKRFMVSLDQMPNYLPLAFLAAEDARFFEHPGIDVKAIMRAALKNLRTGSWTEGASTITQQIIKRLLLTKEKKLKRKIQEAILAYQLENFLTKHDILYLYLNEIYLGNASYGVEAAARTYFGKHVEELTVAECAVLAGLPKAPSRNNPYSEPENIKARQEWVLERMAEVGFISRGEADVAKRQPLDYRSMPDPSWSVGSWYLSEVRRQFLAFFTEEVVMTHGLRVDMVGEDLLYTGGLHIHTAMDPMHQRAAEVALRKGLYDAGKRHGWTGPIQQLPSAAFDGFLKGQRFQPESLENAGWTKALVIAVHKGGAEVRLNQDYKGFVDVKTMSWCRTPNPRVTPEGAARVVDATRVLAVGDVIWVSAVGTTGTTNPVGAPASEDGKGDVPAYKASQVTPDTAIALCLEQLPGVQGAVVSIDLEKGDLAAIVGGYNFSPENLFNRATQARRQPGSSFKPVVYSAALDNGFTAASVLYDTPFVLPAAPGRAVWKPGNFDGKFLGPIILRTALAKSRNVCTVRVAQQIGMRAIVDRAHDLGISGDIPRVLAISLGSYEVTPQNMAEAYTVFANGGEYIKPCIIKEVRNRWNEPVASFSPDRRRAISPENAYIMSYLLKEVVNAGTATRAKALGRPVAGKTGTTNEERDAWFIGFSPYLVTSVYVGYDNNNPMGKNETGARAALPIFVRYRQMVDEHYPPTDFVPPPDITFARVDAEHGYATEGGGESGTLSLPFVAGTVPSSSYYGEGVEHGAEDLRIIEDWIKEGY